MKITEIIHVIFSLIVYQTTYQGPRVSVHISGNLCVCCKPQICCLALRAASHIMGEPRVDCSFWKKGPPSGWLGVRRASLGVTLTQMAEHARY